VTKLTINIWYIVGDIKQVRLLRYTSIYQALSKFQQKNMYKDSLIQCLLKPRISVSTKLKWRIHWPVTLHGHTAGFRWLWSLHLDWT